MVIVLARSRAGLLPDPYCLPRSCAGSASALQLSGPARTLHALRPARLLAHLSVDFSREVSISTVTSAHRSPAIESNHQLFEWVPPPLVFSPFGAHARSPAPHGCHNTDTLVTGRILARVGVPRPSRRGRCPARPGEDARPRPPGRVSSTAPHPVHTARARNRAGGSLPS